MPPENHVHVHLDGTETEAGVAEILVRLTRMEKLMSDTSAALTGLTNAIGAATSRIDEDVAHLHELLQAALTADPANQAIIDQLRAEAAEAVDKINAATAQLSAIDPIADFPAAPDQPPAETPPADQPPAETPPADQPPAETPPAV